MALAEWLVPELSLAASLEMEKGKRALRNHALEEPERIAELACSMLEQHFMQQSIIRKAIGYVSELEMTILLAEPESTTAPAQAAQRYPVRHASRAGVPWPVRLVLKLWGYRLDPSQPA